MNREVFQNCCGMEEVGNFGTTYTAVKKDLAMQLEYMRDEREAVSEGHMDVASGGLIATTVDSQKAAIRALKFHKFRKVFTFTNPGTGNKITLWAKKLVK